MPSLLQWEAVEALAAATVMFLSIIICTGVFRCRMQLNRHCDMDFREVQGLYSSNIEYQPRPSPTRAPCQHHEIHTDQKHEAIYENFSNGLANSQYTGRSLVSEAGVSLDSNLEDSRVYLNEDENIYCNYGVTREENDRFDEDYIIPDENYAAEQPSEFDCE